ncbi:hypothetical protein NDU88_000404, partial [Pleurodeles waltl]
MDNSGSDRRPIGDNSPKEEFNIMMVSDSIKEEEGAYAMADQCSEEVRNTLCPTEEFNTVMVSDSIKEEREALPIADPCSEEVKIASCPAEEEFNIVMVSDSIKEEREACPMTDQCSEDVKNTFCLAVTEEEFSTVMVSDSIKEEREACPMAEQCAEEVKYSFCPAGMVDIASFSTNVKKEEDYSLDRQFSEMNGGIANFVGSNGKWSSEGQAAATTVCAEASGITTSAAADGSPGPSRAQSTIISTSLAVKSGAIQQCKGGKAVPGAWTGATSAAGAGQPSQSNNEVGGLVRSSNRRPNLRGKYPAGAPIRPHGRYPGPPTRGLGKPSGEEGNKRTAVKSGVWRHRGGPRHNGPQATVTVPHIRQPELRRGGLVETVKGGSPPRVWITSGALGETRGHHGSPTTG